MFVFFHFLDVVYFVMRAVYGKAERGEGMEVYALGVCMMAAAGLVWGVVLWRGGMPLWIDRGNHRPTGGASGAVMMVAVMALVWPYYAFLAAYALCKWLWRNAGPPGGGDQGR
ncbi:hypothetical protein NHH88_05925 [Oxalobacteraceae bacterium OTU3CAMAD1]|nr:hypothetical protein NHH88_05925 [Oxalobacteraceae bacterium OTU3CAMAD1]